MLRKIILLSRFVKTIIDSLRILLL